MTTPLLKRVLIPSPNYSSRQGARVRLLVCHTAEGALTYTALGAYFRGNVQASSHVGIDSSPGVIGEYVRRGDKAWTCAAYNPVSANAEICAFASWSRDEWLKHDVMCDNVARWLAEEAAFFGIPLVALTDAQAQGGSAGVCEHKQLGSAGGGHSDCGPGFPLAAILQVARQYASGTAEPAPPTPTQEDENMVASGVADNGTTHVFWAEDDKQTVRYRYQQKGQHDWVDGGVLTKAPKKIAGLSATTTATGTLELFARYQDTSVAHLWQNPGQSAWSGGEEGKQKAAFTQLAGA